MSTTAGPDAALARVKKSIDRLIEWHGVDTALEMAEAMIRELRDHPPVVHLAACVECGRPHAITLASVAWFQTKGYPLPRRCAGCRAARHVLDAGLDAQ